MGIMLIPIRTTMEHKRQPVVTYWLIGLNILIFAVQWSANQSGGTESSNSVIQNISLLEENMRLSRFDFKWWTLISYQFLHAGWMHLIFNMIFLLPFGKSVEGILGHFGFVIFYLLTGALGGLAHILIYSNPVIGASGSVCAVTAAFIVLAPKTYIHVLVVFFIIGVYTVPSLLLVGFFIALDTFSLLSSLISKSSDRTAWLVHLVGYLSGFTFTFLLLSLKLIRSSEYDLLHMVKQSKRRRDFKKSVQTNKLKSGKFPITNSEEENYKFLISENASHNHIEEAYEIFIKARKEFPNIKPNKQALLTIGSSLIQSNKIKEGSVVLEAYLKIYKKTEQSNEVALLLIAKYIRVLRSKERAVELIQEYSDSFLPKHEKLIQALKKEL